MGPEAMASVETPSCHGCRRRKLKCSREQPTCAHCQRLDAPCVYDAKKNKPGVKIGAVESLSRRVAALEQARSDREPHATIPEGHNYDTISSTVTHLAGALTSLTNQIGKLTSRLDSVASSNQCRFDHSPVPSNHLDVQEDVVSRLNASTKRRRVDTEEIYSNAGEQQSPIIARRESTLPSLLQLEQDAVNLYFEKVYFWIPMVHLARFRKAIQDSSERTRLQVIVDAILMATLRFVDTDKHQLSTKEVEHLKMEKRDSVLLAAMKSPSEETLKALIIVAFNDIGDGESTKVWPVLQSLTRTVEYLRLHIEDGDDLKQGARKPSQSLPPPHDWVEEEERRRIFWNIYNLDRYCSITKGWDTNLNSNGVVRRLPADGTYWYAELPVVCPYFGVRKGSLDKITYSIPDSSIPLSTPGNVSITGIQGVNPNHADSQTRVGNAETTHESSRATTVGGFAYSIEATEYLNQIAICFNQKINFDNQQEVTEWLTRFTELDLHFDQCVASADKSLSWKSIIPKRWKDPNHAPDTSTGPGTLDHNMTLAHVTHNTSMILLHYHIAYPPSLSHRIVQLPSSHSAETCRLAATETTHITERWLITAPDKIIVAPQFAFCVYLSAKMFLVYRRYHGVKLPTEFWQLARCLDQMARRWKGHRGLDSHATTNLAAKYAAHLRKLYKECRKNANFTIGLLDYAVDSCSLDKELEVVGGFNNLETSEEYYSEGDLELPWEEMAKESHSSAAYPTLSQEDPDFTERLSAHCPIREDVSQPGQVQNSQETIIIAPGSSHNLQEGQPESESNLSANPAAAQQMPEDLLAISRALMDQSFADMDRIISLDDFFFEDATMDM